MRFRLGDLVPYRIGRSGEYVPGDPDNSYVEMIRVRGSKPVPLFHRGGHSGHNGHKFSIFMVPSHFYKYSETELGLYLRYDSKLSEGEARSILENWVQKGLVEIVQNQVILKQAQGGA